MSESTEKSIDLRERFPDLEPIDSLPRIWNILGFGFGLYGHRGLDPETGTFVRTHCASALGIPVFALGAYRIALTQQGAYILGREPISLLARAWNYLLVCCIIVFGGVHAWKAYTTSPEYVAARSLDTANALAASGDVVNAGRLYRDVALGTTSRVPAARGVPRSAE